MGDFQAHLNADVRLICRKFYDVDDATQIVSIHRPVQIEPISLNPFQAMFYQADFGSLTFIFSEIKSPIYIKGERRSGFVQFGLFLAMGEQPAFVHQQPMTTHMLCGFDADRGTDNFYPANLVISEIQVRQDVLESTLTSMRRDDLDAQFFRQEMIYLPITLSAYRCYLQELLLLVRKRSPLLHDLNYRQMIVGDALPLLIDSIPRQRPALRLSPHPQQRAKLVDRAMEHIQAHLHQPLTLSDLYTALGVSRRTLFYSFESVFGVTPMEYVKVQRLQGVRRSLQQADPKTASISTIAHQWGFWHSGQFAKAYKALFDELPSETLGQPNRVALP